MAQPVLLKQFQHSIPAAAGLHAVRGRQKNNDYSRLRFVLTIDFEKGTLCINGHRKLLVSAGRYDGKTNVQPGRQVSIKMTILPSLVPDLADPETSGSLFSIAGDLFDEAGAHECLGLLALDNVRDSYTVGAEQWNLSVYLYDQQRTDWEFRCRLPLYVCAQPGPQQIVSFYKNK